MAASIALVACGDDDDDDDDDDSVDVCVAVADRCDTAGETRCGDGDVQTCEANDYDCLAWVTTARCEGARTCEQAGAAPQCACQNACDDPGATSCDGDTIVTCAADADGCLALEEVEDCGESLEVCDDTGDTVVCAAVPVVCDDECDADGATSCDGDVIVTCTADADGCLSLVAGADCADGGQTCADVAGDAACVGCGPCDGVGEYCDDAADPEACMTAGTVAEILEGVDVGTGWADLDEVTQRALAARGELTYAQYREVFGPEATADAIETMLTAPTAEMEANYAAFLEPIFGVDSVANESLDELLRRLYVLFLATRQGTAINYQFVPPLNWDGETPMTWFMMPEPESLLAYRELGAELAVGCQALRRDPAAVLTDDERRVLELATAMARQLRVGDTGYYFGDRTQSQPFSMLGMGWDFVLSYHEWGGAIFESDDAFLDQVNAYYLTELIRVHSGTVPAVEFMHPGVFDDWSIETFIGPLAESRTAQLYALLGGFFRDRVLAHPDIGLECYPYSSAELASIWDGFTADQVSDNDGLTTFGSFYGQLQDSYAIGLVSYKARTAAALRTAFPADGAAMSLAEREALIAAIDATESLLDAEAAFLDGLAATGDGTAPAVLEAALAGVTMLFGRDYADPDNGAAWLAEDQATAQAMWDEVRDWVLAEYGIDPGLVTADIEVTIETSTSLNAGQVVWDIASPTSLVTQYENMLNMVSRCISDASGSSWAGPAALGLRTMVHRTGVFDRFAGDTLAPNVQAELPLYMVTTSWGAMAGNGEAEGTIRQFLGECGPDGIVEHVRDVLESYRFTVESVDGSLPYLFLGPWVLQYSYTEIIYTALFAGLQARLDADFGAGTYLLDPFTLQACGIFDPRDDDATYDALATCLD